jgi:hypothetical protein
MFVADAELDAGPGLAAPFSVAIGSTKVFNKLFY